MNNEHHNPKSDSAKFLSFADCAEIVLQRFAGHQPMHYVDITKKAISEGILITEGQTPERSMNARILTEIYRKEQRGEMPRFENHGKGMIGLTAWNASSLERQIDEHNQKQRQALMKKVRALDPKDFEELIKILLIKMGFEEVGTTNYTGDKGVDVRGTLIVQDVIRIKLAVQVKRYSKISIGAPIIRELRGSLQTDEHGLIITSSRFTKAAQEEATRPTSHGSIDLVDGTQLINLMVEHDIGVYKNRYQLLELSCNLFEEVNS